MDEPLKRRLVGATVLVALAIIFLPMLLEREPANLKPLPVEPIPKEPPRNFDDRLLQQAAPGAGEKPAGRPQAPAPGSKPAPVPKPPAAGGATGEPTSRSSGRKPAPARAKSKPKPKPGSKAPVVQKPRSGAQGSPSAWVVQVASLSNLENARKLVKKLRQAGLDTMDPKPVKVKGKRYYRVLVGPEVAKKNAERHQALIQKLTGTRGRVVRYP